MREVEERYISLLADSRAKQGCRDANVIAVWQTDEGMSVHGSFHDSPEAEGNTYTFFRGDILLVT